MDEINELRTAIMSLIEAINGSEKTTRELIDVLTSEIEALRDAQQD